MRNHLRLLYVWLLIIVLAACVPSRVTSSPGANPTARATATATKPAATATRAATPTRSRSTPQVTPSRPTATPKGTVKATSGTLKAYFLDVGQGDSILLAGPDFTILIDTGRQDHAEVAPYLEQIGVKSIDLLVGTHPHADHIGQFPEVLKRFPVRQVWMSGDTNTTKTFEDAIDAVAASGAAYHEPRAGEIYQIGSARIEVLNPTHLTGEPNEGSVAFRLIFGDIAFMFMGDAEAPTEREIIASGRNLQAQIIKLGHHGSNTSSSLAFLLAVKPQLAIWSAGKDNTYGHPSPETIDRLQRLGVPVMGTIDYGTIEVETDGKKYWLDDFDTGTPLTPVAPTPTRVSGCRPDQVNINTAAVDALQAITQIGPARARQMITLRPFTSLDDMDRITGITPATIEKIKAQGLACVD